MPGNKDNNQDDFGSPELEEVEDPPERTRKTAMPVNPHKHFSKLDPVLMEKLETVGAEIETSARRPDYSASNELPRFTSPPPRATLARPLFMFLLLAVAGFAAFRWLGGDPVLPAVVSEAIFGPPPPTVLPPAKVTIQTDLVGYEVRVNGAQQTPFNGQIEVPAGNELVEIVVKRVGYTDYSTKIIPSSGTNLVVTPTLKPIQATGFLTYETIPEAKLTLYRDGKVAAEFNTPITGAKVPVGIYRAVLENSFIGYRSEETLLVEEWKTLAIHKQLQSPKPAEAPASSPVNAASALPPPVPAP